MINSESIPIWITGAGQVSAAGVTLEDLFKVSSADVHVLNWGSEGWNGAISEAMKKELSLTRKTPDLAIQMASLAAQAALAQTRWTSAEKKTSGLILGSSRGLTRSLESSYLQFYQTQTVPVTTSPQTTSGRLVSQLANELGLGGAFYSLSITCSSALMAVLNAIAWMKAGMINKFIVGGSEAACTPFTIRQLKALRIYSKPKPEERWPCRPFDQDYPSGLVLSEAAALMALEAGVPTQPPLAQILGWGIGHEIPGSDTGISANGQAFYEAMQAAIKCDKSSGAVDVIITHSPGTAQGDQAEFTAIQQLWGDTVPFLYPSKWLTGHTFGASGALAILQAIGLFSQKAPILYPPWMNNPAQPKSIRKCLINAGGFGGQAISILLGAPNA
ncbi:MAG: hypothetical protein EBS07_08780 [Sphingobacteriia bacterium]|nr:hypothetical protein [Sphingobacteriia bacterium]